MGSFFSLATAILGLLLLLPLLMLRNRRPSNGWLGLFVYCITSLALADYCVSTGVYLRYPYLWGLFDWPVAAIAAVFYCYVRSMTGLGNGWRQAVHFVPLLCVVGLITSVRLQRSNEQLQQLLAQPTESAAASFLWLQLLTVAYGIAILYRLWQYRTRLKQHYASTTQRDLKWLQWLTFAVIALLVVWLPAVQSGGYWLTLLDVSRLMVLYAFGWFALKQQQVFLPSLSEVSLHVSESALPSQPLNLPEKDAVPPSAEPQQSAESSRYARSGMTEAAATLIGQRLILRMQVQQDYLDNDLTLSELAQRIGTSPQLLSEYLNVVLQQNFFDFINGYRVAAVQQQIRLGVTAGQSDNLLSIALGAGFNSKSTFNAAFRKHSGMTPSAWRALQLQQRKCEPIGSDDHP